MKPALDCCQFPDILSATLPMIKTPNVIIKEGPLAKGLVSHIFYDFWLIKIRRNMTKRRKIKKKKRGLFKFRITYIE